MFLRKSSSRLAEFLAASLLFAGLSTVLGSTLGCRIAVAPNRIERAEIHQEKLADAPLPVHAGPNIDEAQQVIASCGQPVSDTVQPIYSKYYNGPVRRMEYPGHRPITLDFIPSWPKAQLAHTEAPLPEHPGYQTLPPNATWQFQAGFMEQEQMVTASRLAKYLPCAAEALRAEF